MRLAFASLMLLTWSCARQPAEAPEESAAALTPKQIGLFAGNGAGAEYVAAVKDALKDDARFKVATFTNGSVDFNAFDVVVFPGGTGSAEWNALGASGQQKLKSFVTNGGGYVGICAGFYMALSSKAGFVTGEAYDPWARGEGKVTVKFESDAGVFTDAGTHEFKYVNGPLVQPIDGSAYTVLATFQSNIGSSSILSMVGQPAVVGGSYGQGRVVAFSPHPELSGLGSLLKDALLWSAR
jgi:glutamine amidotransferase-like uncharacterized protein